MHTKSYHYPLLNDGDWLRQKYEVDGLSTKQILPFVGAKTANSVRQALIRHGIPVRSISEGLTHNREDDGFIIDHEVIEGCLLGDGYLSSWNKESNGANAYFAKRNKYYDHICFVAKSLYPDCWKESVKEATEYYEEKPISVFALRSLSRKELNPYYDRWYPRNTGRVKIVPEDVALTPKVLLHWFLDDGSSYRRRKDSPVKQVIITLSSESFNKADNEMLAEKMKQTFGIEPHVKPIGWGSGYRLEISQKKSPAFFEVIGEPVVPSLSYKWK